MSSGIARLFVCSDADRAVPGDHAGIERWPCGDDDAIPLRIDHLPGPKVTPAKVTGTFRVPCRVRALRGGWRAPSRRPPAHRSPEVPDAAVDDDPCRPSPSERGEHVAEQRTPKGSAPVDHEHQPSSLAQPGRCPPGPARSRSAPPNAAAPPMVTPPGSAIWSSSAWSVAEAPAVETSTGQRYLRKGSYLGLRASPAVFIFFQGAGLPPPGAGGFLVVGVVPEPEDPDRTEAIGRREPIEHLPARRA